MTNHKQQLIDEGYHISDFGTIQDPGAFEGCFWPAVIFDEMAGHGQQDEILWNSGAEEVVVFFVDANDRQQYELSDNTYAVTVYKSGSGFVYFSEWTKAAYESMAIEFEGMDDEELESWEFSK